VHRLSFTDVYNGKFDPAVVRGKSWSSATRRRWTRTCTDLG